MGYLRGVVFMLLWPLLLALPGGCSDSADERPPINTSGSWGGSFSLENLRYDVAFTLRQEGWGISGTGVVGGYAGRVTGIVRLDGVDLDFYSYDTVLCCFLGQCYESEYLKLYFTGSIVGEALVDRQAYLSSYCSVRGPFYLRLERQ